MLPLLSLTLVALAQATTPRAVILLVADDLGFNDVSFQTPDYSIAQTPNLDKLAKRGVRFTNHHVQPFCSPTRAALLTGRYVLRYGLQNSVIWPQDAFAIPSNETLLSQNMQNAGYKTTYIGKWHLGFYKKEFLPMNRGFDEDFGYYLGGEDYWDHTRNGGLDFHRNGSIEAGLNGTYSATAFADEAVSFIQRMAAANEKFFMYLPFQSVHSPLQAPDANMGRFANYTGNVKTRGAMVNALDDAVGRVTEALTIAGLLNDTLLVFTADNGAPFGNALDMGDDNSLYHNLHLNTRPPGYEQSGFGVNEDKKKPERPPNGTQGPGKRFGGGGGSNYPFSGWKHYVFEGGVRSASFVFWPAGLGARAGTQHAGLFHAVDWLPTLTKIVATDTSKNLPLDGVDIWSAIMEGGSSSPRTEIPVEIAACSSNQTLHPTARTIVDGPQAAMIVGELKVIVDCWWRETKLASTAQLYNITADPAETVDLAKQRPDDVTRLLGRLDYYEQQSLPPYPVDKSCGEGKPQKKQVSGHGEMEVWDTWC